MPSERQVIVCMSSPACGALGLAPTDDPAYSRIDSRCHFAFRCSAPSRPDVGHAIACLRDGTQ
jgi:hypothetical protein